jgi:hypothetical protein
MFHLQNSTDYVISSYAKVYELADWVPHAFNHIGCSYILNEAYEEFEDKHSGQKECDNIEKLDFFLHDAGGDRVRTNPAKIPKHLIKYSKSCKSIGKGSNPRCIRHLVRKFTLESLLRSRRFIDAESIKHLPSNWAYNNPKITDLLFEELKQPFMESNVNKTHGNKFDKKCWRIISRNPVAIHLLERNLDMVDWETLVKNPAGIKLAKLNSGRINWRKVNLYENIELIGLIYKDPGSRLMSEVRKIISNYAFSTDSPESCDWDFLSKFKTYRDENYFNNWIFKNIQILDKEWILENQVAVQKLIDDISSTCGHYGIMEYLNVFV